MDSEPHIRRAARDEPVGGPPGPVPVEVRAEPAGDVPGGEPPAGPAGPATARAGLLGPPLAPRRRLGRITALLVGLAVIATGFVAGAQVQKRYGGEASTAAPVGLSRSGGPGGGFGGPGGAGASADPGQGSATTGTVERVDGDTVYVRTASGAVVAVRTDGSTAVQLAASAPAVALTPGATVTVAGQANADGSITASRITQAR